MQPAWVEQNTAWYCLVCSMKAVFRVRSCGGLADVQVRKKSVEHDAAAEDRKPQLSVIDGSRTKPYAGDR